MNDAEKLRRCLEEGDWDDHIAPLLMDEVDRLRAEVARLAAENARLAREFADFRRSHATTLALRALRERDAVIDRLGRLGNAARAVLAQLEFSGVISGDSVTREIAGRLREVLGEPKP